MIRNLQSSEKKLTKSLQVFYYSTYQQSEYYKDNLREEISLFNYKYMNI